MHILFQIDKLNTEKEKFEKEKVRVIKYECLLDSKLRYCERCGTKLDFDASYCHECGKDHLSSNAESII
ncbi:MAG: hypothetical protein MUP85_11975 [Candidatus Lokiarchaeota archaeon]|nr:hypothetical protein [Candidatus Lokiarchaeota archaeon]